MFKLVVFMFAVSAVLSVYLLKTVGLDPMSAMKLFHVFMALCYIFPLVGGFLADALIGRFW